MAWERVGGKPAQAGRRGGRGGEAGKGGSRSLACIWLAVLTVRCVLWKSSTAGCQGRPQCSMMRRVVPSCCRGEEGGGV